MKKIAYLVAILAGFLAQCAFASAVVASLAGTATAQSGSAPLRPLRVGDQVVQGDTVSTGPNSSVVLRFEDGQVAALTSNSRMTVTAYQFNQQSRTGSILLSLIDGGMRAVTGLIGRNSPQRVTYRAATATIGIRGTDVTIVTSEGNVVVTVTEGAVSFTFGGKTIIIPAGQGVDARSDGTFRQSAAEQIIQQIPPALAAEINGLQGLTDAINRAANTSIQSTNTPSGTNTPGGGTTTGTVSSGS